IVLPGFVNAHSHAFHRHLRGKSGIGGKAADTFWKWRDNMYALVDGITTEKLYEYCYTTFREMLEAGITTVGEFHYVHHGTGKFDLDSTVLKAAQDAGIRITLIQVDRFDAAVMNSVFQGPSDVLLENLEIGALFSAVHATYTPLPNMKKFTQLGANVVVCPCTEGYLGDGIPHVIDNQHISFGTDCNNRISFLEEMRWACYSQQVRLS
ncbi:amidohydrolase family protein, partial [Ostertagia ostertagi]